MWTNGVLAPTICSEMAVQNTHIRNPNHDILREGLKFDNDRQFKNRLMLKVIFVMATLVFIATCSFVAWSKMRAHMSVSTSNDVSSKPQAIMIVPERISRRDIVTEENEISQDSSTRSGSNISKRQTKFWDNKDTADNVRKLQADRMKSYMDTNANPCDDFYQYACGKWNHYNAIPDDRAGFDTFEILRDSLDLALRDMLEETANVSGSTQPSSITKAKTLYRSCMNEEILEKRGKEPLLVLLGSLGGWPILQSAWNSTSFDWVHLIANLRLYYNDVLITFWIGQDFMASSKYIIQFDQATLGLSTRNYFLKDQNKVYRDAYKKYIVETAILLGADESTATSDAQEILEFEIGLANVTVAQEERRNISQMYQKLTVSELESQIPFLKWRSYLSTVLGWNVSDAEPVVLFARKYFVELENLLLITPPRTLANYILWRFVKHRANNLNSQFQDVKQTFLHAMFGREKLPSRWTTCVHHVNGNMGMALGSLFVRRYFDESSKNDTVEMTQSIMQTFKEMLEGVTWIDEDTRRLAQEKLQAITLRIGYPDFILNQHELDIFFQNVTVFEEQYFENTLNVLRFVAQSEINKLQMPVNKTHWNTPPAIVNAYYSRNKNQILFPAGILQPPFYHKHFPRSLNYGGIGVVIGHEIIHGFDDKGRLYDFEGNLNRWWKDEAIQTFHRKAKCLIDQYNTYTVEEVNMRVDGVNTQGENIADNGGIKQAFKAYKTWEKANNYTLDVLEGINATNYQLFFINFAQVWCGAMRTEASRNKLQTAVHPPGRFRVIGTLSNSDEFARVFNCPAGSPMNPQDKCSVW